MGSPSKGMDDAVSLDCSAELELPKTSPAAISPEAPSMTSEMRASLSKAVHDLPTMGLPSVEVVGLGESDEASDNVDWDEERIDPDQKKVWTFREYHETHAQRFNAKDIRDYWNLRCRPFVMEGTLPEADQSGGDNSADIAAMEELHAQLSMEQAAAQQEVLDRQQFLDKLGQQLKPQAVSSQEMLEKHAFPGPPTLHQAALQRVVVQQAMREQVASSLRAPLQPLGLPPVLGEAALQQAALEQAALQQATVVQHAMRDATFVQLLLESQREALAGDDVADDETRIDPDGKTWTYAEYREAHLITYSLIDIRDYWRCECKPSTEVRLPEKLVLTEASQSADMQQQIRQLQERFEKQSKDTLREVRELREKNEKLEAQLATAAPTGPVGTKAADAGYDSDEENNRNASNSPKRAPRAAALKVGAPTPVLQTTKVKT